MFLFNDMVLLIKETEKTAKIYYKEYVEYFHFLTVPRDYRSTYLAMCCQDRDRCERSEFLVTFAKSEDQAQFFTHITTLQNQKIEQTGAQMVWKLDTLCDSVESLCQHAALSCGTSVVFFSGVKTDQRSFSPDFLTYVHEENLFRNLPISQMTNYEGPLPPRRKHTATYMDGCIYIIGGILRQNNAPYIAQFNIAKKSIVNVCRSAQLKRYGHSCVAYNHQLFVFGGKTKPDKTVVFLNDVTCINVEKNTVLQMQVRDPKPEPRYDHGVVVFEDRMYIYGGKGQKGVLSDLWSFDLKAFTWRQEQVSPKLIPRRSPLMLMLGPEMVILGGFPATYRRLPIEAVDLAQKRSRIVKAVGNIPPCLKYMGGAITINKEIIVYGGLQYKSHTPQSAIYVIELSQEWRDSIELYEADHPPSEETMSQDAWNALLNTSCCHTVLGHRSMWMPQPTYPHLRPDISQSDFIVLARTEGDPKTHPLRATLDARRANTGSLTDKKEEFKANRRSLNVRHGTDLRVAEDHPDGSAKAAKQEPDKPNAKRALDPVVRARTADRSSRGTRGSSSDRGERRSIDISHGGIPLPSHPVLRPANSHENIEMTTAVSSSLLLQKEPPKPTPQKKPVPKSRARPASMVVSEKQLQKQFGVPGSKAPKNAVPMKPVKEANQPPRPGTSQVKLSQVRGSGGSRSAAPPRSRHTTSGARRSSSGRSSFRLF